MKKTPISVSTEAKNDTIICDNSILQSALINIGVNASHAMPNAGEITISTRNILLSKDFCEHSLFEIEPGEYIEISIKDTGTGIPPENLQKIFEPFYTTKEQGKGTGLGLAAVYGAVWDHHGCITLQSTVG